jgi:hypothetical protein
MHDITVLTDWLTDANGNHIHVAELYPGEWTDITGQPDEEITPTPNVFIAQGRISDATFTALAADSQFLILTDRAF